MHGQPLTQAAAGAPGIGSGDITFGILSSSKAMTLHIQLSSKYKQPATHIMHPHASSIAPCFTSRNMLQQVQYSYSCGGIFTL